MSKSRWIFITLALALVGSLAAASTSAQGQPWTDFPPPPADAPIVTIYPSSVPSAGTYDVAIDVLGFPRDEPLIVALCEPGNIAVPRTVAEFEASCTIVGGAWGPHTYGIQPLYPQMTVPAEGVMFLAYISSSRAEQGPNVGTYSAATVAFDRLIPGASGDSGQSIPPTQRPFRPAPVAPPPTQAPAPDPTATAEPDPTPDPESSNPVVDRSEVQLRNNLIAAQETLLNGYRCRFGVDVAAVAGGCAGTVPAVSPVQAVVFQGTPTQSAIDQRDALIASQEALLNAYRCRFNVDTQEVPGGCPG